MQKRVIFLLSFIVLLFAFVGFFRLGNWGASFLWQVSNQGRFLFPLVSLSALIDSLNPCAFSILLLTIAFLFSLGKLRRHIFKVGSFYILGIFVAYLLIGLGILHAFHLFNTPRFMGKLGASLLILLGGINLLDEFFPSFPIKLKIPHFAHGKMAKLIEKSSLPAAFFLGVLVGLCEFPCTGGPYLMVLGLLHDQTTYLKGLTYLLWYNFLFVSPLFLILLLASEKSLHEKIKSWRKENLKRLRIITSVAMIMLGLLIFLL